MTWFMRKIKPNKKNIRIAWLINQKLAKTHYDSVSETTNPT